MTGFWKLWEGQIYVSDIQKFSCYVRINFSLHSVKQSHTGLGRPLGLQEAEASRFLDNRHMKPYAPAAFTPQERLLISVRG